MKWRKIKKAPEGQKLFGYCESDCGEREMWIGYAVDGCFKYKEQDGQEVSCPCVALWQPYQDGPIPSPPA